MPSQDFEIHHASPQDAQTLTRIAHAAKRYWQYPEEYILQWKDALTITPEFIVQHPVYCAIQGAEICGFYALSGDGNTRELEHLWVSPEYIRTGVGSRLLNHALALVREEGGKRLRIVSDPHAAEFYKKWGAQRIGEIPSTPGDRTLPLLEIELL